MWKICRFTLPISKTYTLQIISLLNSEDKSQSKMTLFLGLNQNMFKNKYTIQICSRRVFKYCIYVYLHSSPCYNEAYFKANGGFI